MLQWTIFTTTAFCPKHVVGKLNLLLLEIQQFLANQNYVIKNFDVVMSAVIKRVDWTVLQV